MQFIKMQAAVPCECRNGVKIFQASQLRVVMNASDTAKETPHQNRSHTLEYSTPPLARLDTYTSLRDSDPKLSSRSSGAEDRTQGCAKSEFGTSKFRASTRLSLDRIHLHSKRMSAAHISAPCNPQLTQALYLMDKMQGHGFLPDASGLVRWSAQHQHLIESFEC